MNEPTTIRITLRLEGARAEHGVSLADFESFIDGFLAALRDFDRHRRGEATRKSGAPEKRAAAVQAFRLLYFQPGSGIATIEPEALAEPEQDALETGDVPLQVENLRALAEAVSGTEPVAPDVVDALARSVRVLGEDGSLEIEMPRDLAAAPIRIDSSVLARLRARREQDPEEVSSITGRLHLLDLEPDRIGVRAPDGTEWACAYPAELEILVLELAGKVVVVRGAGRRTSPLRGTLQIEEIEQVGDFEQSPLFTEQTVSVAQLMADQSINGPQHLDALSDPQWDDDADAEYLDALLNL
jgi:hypothetical protein